MQNFEKKSFYFVESVSKADLMDAFKRLKKSGQSFCREETIYNASKVESPPCSCCKGSTFQRVRKTELGVGLRAYQRDLPNPASIARIVYEIASSTHKCCNVLRQFIFLADDRANVTCSGT
ncbi:hypothetical protein AB3S75_028842 [Citrus x aurantiifolia]